MAWRLTICQNRRLWSGVLFFVRPTSMAWCLILCQTDVYGMVSYSLSDRQRLPFRQRFRQEAVNEDSDKD